MAVVPFVPWLLGAMLLVLCGCGESPEAGATGDERVLILAAASTQDALEQIADMLQEQGGPTLTVSAAGSNALAQQIIAGAPGDLFLSANS